MPLLGPAVERGDTARRRSRHSSSSTANAPPAYSKWRGWSCCISAPAAKTFDEACSDTSTTANGKNAGPPPAAVPAPVFADSRKATRMPAGQQQQQAVPHHHVSANASSPDSAAAAAQQQQWQQQAVVTATAASGSSTALTRDSLTTVAAVSSSSSTLATGRPQRQHHHVGDNSSSFQSDLASLAAQQQQQEQQQEQLALLSDTCAADGLHASCLQQLPPEIVGGRAGGGLSGCASCCATASSVAGFSESVVPSGAALLPAASAASASVFAAGSDSKHPAGRSPTHSGQLPAPAAAPAGNDGAEGADVETGVEMQVVQPTPDSSDSLSLPPDLAAQLRKMESGMSFRMLQAELSSEASTAAAAAVRSSGSGPVSRRSTAELLLKHPCSSELQVAPEAGFGAATPPAAAALPALEGPANRALNAKLATVHSESLASRSAAGAASACGSGTSSRHQRSGSSGSRGTFAAGTGGGAAAVSSSSYAAHKQAAASADGPGAVRRTLSASSSPFAHLGFQHTVAASLAPRAHAAAGRPSTAAAAPAAATGGGRASGPDNSSSSLAADANLSAAAATAAQQPAMLPAQGSVRSPSRVSWASSVAAQAQPAAVFQLLCGGDAATLAAATESSTAAGDGSSDSSARILRPSRSVSILQEGPALSRSSSFVSRLQGLRLTKSTVALRTQNQQLSVPAAAAGGSSSNGAGGGRVQQGLSQVDSAPASASSSGPGTWLLRGILQRPANLSSSSNSSSTAAAAAVMADGASDRPKGARLSLENAPRSTTGMAASAGLPPLPRPVSAVLLDVLTAAAGGRGLGGGSPFASRHALPANLAPAISNSTLPNSTSLRGQPGFSTGVLLLSAHSNGSSSLGQPSSSNNGSGSSGNGSNNSVASFGGGGGSAAAAAAAEQNPLLISAAVRRMPSVAAAGSSSSLLAPAGWPPLLGSSDSFGSVDLASSSSVGDGGVSSQASMHVAAAFAEAFIAALAGGDTKWASGAVLSGLLAEAAKMVGLDKQLYVGRAAIIRRLNGGMQQLVKMAGATAADSGGAGTSSSSSSHASTAAAGGTADADADHQPDTDAASLAALGSCMPKPQLSVSCPDPRSRPSQAVAVYTFKWGIRKFTLRDEFIVKGGQVLRLRRSRG